MPATTIDAQIVRRWIAECARVLADQRTYLTDLDAAIGDADHGVNMDRGFKAAVSKVEPLPADATPGAILRTTGAALMSSIGGASGPLWGMAFRRAAQHVGEAAEIDGPLLAGLLEQMDQAMRGLGKAVPGDKTMLDALAPAGEALRREAEAGATLADALAAACTAAETGRDATLPLQARKGRASYLGERSIGHLDPGATSAAMILRALETAVLSADSPAA
jgi:dihydroxyacetone kinase-like protein